MWQLFLLLSVAGCRSLVWNNLKVMEESFEYFKAAGNNAMSSIDLKLMEIRLDLEAFIKHIDDDKMILSIKSLPEVDGCPENSFNLEAFRKSFRIQIAQLELPVSARARHLKEKYTEIEASLATYKSLADSRWWACKFSGSDCTENVETWLSRGLASLSCQISPDCLAHKISKRSPQWNTFGWQENDESRVEVHEGSSCESYEVRCPGGLCVDRDSYMRGETSCPSTTIRPPICEGKYDCYSDQKSGLFTGIVDRCIDLSKVCDGNFDCINGSDEINCHSQVTVVSKSCDMESGGFLCDVESGGFLCDNRECIGLSQVCDGSDSCGDGSDEGGQCGVGSCDGNCNRGVCFKGPKGPMCLSRCPPGTTETPAGCLKGGEDSKSSLSEILEDMPGLMNRQISAHYSLRTKATELIAKYLDEAARCRGGYFLSIGSIYKLNSHKQNKSLETTTEASITSSNWH